MKFSVNLKKLHDAVKNVKRATDTKSKQWAYESITLTATKHKLSLSARDRNTLLREDVEATCSDETVSIAVDAKVLSSVLKSLNPKSNMVGEFEMEKGKVNNEIHLRLRVGDMEQSLIASTAAEKSETYSHVDFSETDFSTPDVKFCIQVAVLRRITEKTLIAVGTDETCPAMMGALFRIRKNNPNPLVVVATDSHRLVLMECPLDTINTAEERDYDFIVPSKTLSILYHTLPTKDTSDAVTVTVKGGLVRFEWNSKELTARAIDETFPRYENVIPLNNHKVLVVDAKAMIKLLEAAKPNADMNMAKLTIESIGDKVGKLTIEAKDETNGLSFSQNLMGVWNQEESFSIGFNVHYLIDALKHIDTPKAVFEFDTATRAAIIKPFDSEEAYSLLMLLMPMRLSQSI